MLPDGLQELILQLMSKSPDDRPRHPADVALRLATWTSAADLRGLSQQTQLGMRLPAPAATLASCDTPIAPRDDSPLPDPGLRTPDRSSLVKTCDASVDSPSVDSLLLRVVGTPFVYAAPVNVQSIVVGRQRRAGGTAQEGCDLVVRLPETDQRNLQISRRHFRIRRDGAACFLQDLSKAGTSLNGQRLRSGEEWPLRDGDHILIADLVEFDVLSVQRTLPLIDGSPLVSCRPGGTCEQLMLEVTLGDLRTMELGREGT